MNPVVGLDVAKGESQVQAFLDQAKPYVVMRKITTDIKVVDDFITCIIMSI